MEYCHGGCFLFIERRKKEEETEWMSTAPHPEHDAMFYVEQNLFLLPVVSDEGMQGVTMGHPSNQA